MRKRKNRRHAGLYIILLIMLAAALLYDSNYRLVTEEYEVCSEKIPERFDGFRITQLSDIHAAVYGEDNKKLLTLVARTEPDIIAVTGDLIDSDDQGATVRPLMAALTEIAPTYYVTGNHEWDSGGIWELFDILEECGVRVLRNGYEVLERDGQRLIIAGVDDPNGPADMKMPEQLAQEIGAAYPEEYVVLLAHRNDRFPQYAACGYDLVLSGHAHGGIVRLPFTDGLVSPNRELFPTLTSGLYYEGESTAIISRGVGNHTGFPRVLNNPHIPVAVLKHA